MPETVITGIPKSSTGWRLKYLAPVFIFIVIAVFLGIGLTLDPRQIPLPLIDKPAPKFDLPPVKGRSLGLAK